MKRRLTGSLGNLPPDTILRLLSATATSGVLEIDSEAGPLRLEIRSGRVPSASDDELELANRVLSSTKGTFVFEPQELDTAVGVTLPLTAYADAAQSWSRRKRASFSSEVDVERLLGGDLIDFSEPTPGLNIHVLGEAPPENPLEDLLSVLETTAPEELLLSQVGVATSDPRTWRGSLESNWRRRGWEVHLFGVAGDVNVNDLDVLLIHHRMSITRVGTEEDWIDLVHRAAAKEPPVPVVWIGPLGDPLWVNRLIEAGVAFMLPPPQGETGETFHRFIDGMTTVIERLLRTSHQVSEPAMASAVSDLIDGLLHDIDPERGVSSLLQLAAGTLTRGAVLRVEDMAFRCWAGFGYPLAQGSSALPRGVGLLERVVRRREPVVGLDPGAGGSRQLANMLGLGTLPAATAIVPLGAGTSVVGVLVVDRDGETLPDLHELILLVSRLGGIVLQG